MPSLESRLNGIYSEIQESKLRAASNLTAKGVQASSTENIVDLADKISQIQSGSIGADFNVVYRQPVIAPAQANATRITMSFDMDSFQGGLNVGTKLYSLQCNFSWGTVASNIWSHSLCIVPEITLSSQGTPMNFNSISTTLKTFGQGPKTNTSTSSSTFSFVGSYTSLDLYTGSNGKILLRLHLFPYSTSIDYFGGATMNHLWAIRRTQT